MKILISILCLYFNLSAFSQDLHIGVIDRTMIVQNSDMDKLLKKDILTFGNFLQDSMILVCQKSIEDFYRNAMRNIERSCWHGPFYTEDLESELQERHAHFVKFIKTVNEALLFMEDSLLKLRDVKFKEVVDSIVLIKGLDVIVYLEGVLYLNPNLGSSNISEEVLKVFNRNFKPSNWKESVSLMKKRLITGLNMKKDFRLKRPKLSQLYESDFFTLLFLSLYHNFGV